MPQLIIKGRWLQELGFNTGQSVTFTVQRSQLLIRIVAE
ncbi:SymE family type I addiction module toxin [Brenneria tiliae]|nr:SymE family type I addiction module toxin [Brenneria tiliae]MCL2895864.1 type I toxin-antitoxin system SymE family toxin [Brenneria tiliae]MCL2900405.1 type I toxin-antitoxin system SymE family toxin [Brenneria tiliae]